MNYNLGKYRKTFNKKYLSKKNFENIKYDFQFVIEILRKKKTKLNNQKIIDVGCSNGSFLYLLKKNYPNNSYYGLELDKNLLDLNKKNKLLNDIVFFKGSVKKKFSTKKYNLITFLGTLNIFENQEFILKNLFTHLRSKGLLIFNCYLNKDNIDLNINYRKYLKKYNIKNAIYIKSYELIKKFLTKTKLLSFFIIPNPYPRVIKKKKGGGGGWFNIYTLKINKQNIRSNNLGVLYDQYLIIAKKK